MTAISLATRLPSIRTSAAMRSRRSSPACAPAAASSSWSKLRIRRRANFRTSKRPQRPLWEAVAERVHGWGSDFVGADGLSPVGAVVGATYPEHARRARELMPDSTILVPGYGAQGASAEDAIVAARADGLGAIVSASRSLMYAYLKVPGMKPGIADVAGATRGVAVPAPGVSAASGVTPGVAAAAAAATMREALNHALTAAGKNSPA